MGGVGLQQFFIFIFLAFSIAFQRKISSERKLDATRRRSALMLLYTLYAVLSLITVS